MSTPAPTEAQGAPEAARLLTAQQVGERWQVNPAHVLRLAREGKLASVRLGKYVRFSLAAIEQFEAAGGTA